MDYLAFFVGAFVLVWVVSRTIRRLLFKESSGWKRAIAPNLGTLVVATVLGGLGMADGGSPQFLNALLQYLPPIAVWVALDAWKATR